MSKVLAELRSRRWFGASDMRGFAHRQRMQQMGLRREDVMQRPIVALVNTWSDLTPCHAHLRERAEAVQRGVLLARRAARVFQPNMSSLRSLSLLTLAK